MQRSHPSVFAIASAVAVIASVPRARATDVSEPYRFAERAPDRPRITLTFVDFVELPTGMLAATQSEAAALVARLGVDADIRTVPPGSTLDPEELTLILVRGSAPALTGGVMGAVQRGASARVLWVYPANVAAGTRLAWSKRLRWSVRERERFAIAMGRVAVHEVVHLVCPWREHDREGLMAGILNHSTLTGSRLPLTRELLRDFTLGVDALGGAAVSVARRGPVGPR